MVGEAQSDERQVHHAGAKLFVDYSGKRPVIVDRKTGELIEVELFVAVLGAYNYTYAEATRTTALHQRTRCSSGLGPQASRPRHDDMFRGDREIWFRAPHAGSPASGVHTSSASCSDYASDPLPDWRNDAADP